MAGTAGPTSVLEPILAHVGDRAAGVEHLAGDDSLGFMTKWLRSTGHQTRSAGIRANIDCSAKAVDRLIERTEQLAERHGRRVVLIGQSRRKVLADALVVL